MKLELEVACTGYERADGQGRRKVWKSEGESSNVVGIICPPLVWIGLTDLHVLMKLEACTGYERADGQSLRKVWKNWGRVVHCKYL